MPISRRTRDANHLPPTADLSLRTPQVRVLAVLMPDDHTLPLSEWRVVTSKQLGIRAGYSGTSGSITRALNGLREGSSSGKAHPGLLVLGLVEEVILDIDGVSETNYRITAAGVRAYQSHATKGKLPTVKDAAKSTNRRYLR